MATEKYLAFDAETYYDNECSVSVLGNYAYTHHPLFECYMVSIVTDDGWEWCGHPKDCPWDRLRGYTWLSQNMGFDWAVFRRLVELGIAPADVEPKEWLCTANLCVYVGLSRALGLAVKAAFGVEVDKGIRNNEMKGMIWDTAPEDLKRRVLAYALDDSRWCLKLWRGYSHEWPEHERWLSRHTYEIGAHGVCVDVPALDRDIAFLRTVVEENYNRIPWTSGMCVQTGTDTEGEPVYGQLPPMTPLSKKALKMKCDEVGIPMPSSLAQDSEECAAWEDQYGDRYDWIARMRTWRRTNALLKKFEAMRTRVMPNGRMEFVLLYFGASTGRWSGAGGLNVQNLARQAFVFDADFHMVDRDPKDARPTDTLVDMRSKIIAPPGHVLIASDLSQIEPRCLAMMAGDRAFIQAVRSGQGPYEAHARATMGWTGGPLKKENPQLYLLSKARLLALGYSAGFVKFVMMARNYVGEEAFRTIFEKQPTEEELFRFQDYLGYFAKKGKPEMLNQWNALDEKMQWVWVQSWLQVTDFRESNPKITGFWKLLGEGLAASVGSTYEVEMPSGRTLKYFNVTKVSGEHRVRTTRLGNFSRAYAGLLAENCLARGTLVVTNRGLVEIQNVCAGDLLWDGVGMVAHGGLVYKGEQSVIDCHGIAATPDHLFLVGDEWVSAERACVLPITQVTCVFDENTNTKQHVVMEGLHRHAGGIYDGDSPSRLRWGQDTVGGQVRLRECSDTPSIRCDAHPLVFEEVPFSAGRTSQEAADAWSVKTPSVCSVAVHETTLREPQSSRLQELRGAWHNRVRRMAQIVRRVLGRHGAFLGIGTGTGPDGQRCRLFSRELPLGYIQRECSKSATVKDAWVGSGPRGFAWSRAFDSRLPGEVRDDMGAGVGDTSGERERQSGQRQAGLSEDAHTAHVYDIINCGPRNRFAVVSAAGEVMIVHNCTQAVARDVFADGLRRVVDAGHKVIFHVHDEMVIQAPEGTDPAPIVKMMSTAPKWWPALPVGAEADVAKHYKK